ncbi:MAG: M23 family metallopeptidase [Clostridia bacterium]|nr:M23 family metallopeptidase [Clostridia bacterium]
MSEGTTLRIHTRMTPGAPQAAPAEVRKRPRLHRRRRGRPRAAGSSPAIPRRALPKRLSWSDRLMRNSAIACAVLLGVLALGNIDQPWATKAAEGIEQALTMRIDLDGSLGRLSFVQGLMPESALVFLNVSPGTELALPVEGAVSHPWSSVQPWLLFEPAEGAQVIASEAGTVTAVSPLSTGGVGLLVDHGEGMESVCAGLSQASVAVGDPVSRGQALGTAGERVYFELRINGEPIDPTERLGL